METGFKRPKIDLNTFLNSIKIKDIDNLRFKLQKRDVDISELMDFSQQDLDLFLKTDLGLDTLSRNRFKREIRELNNIKSRSKTKDIIKQSMQSMQIQQRKVFISNHEQQSIFSLYERYDIVSALQKTIMDQIPNLDKQMAKCINSINKQFDDILIASVIDRKQQLLKNIETLEQNKMSQLNQQCEILKRYQSELNDAKKKRQEIINQTKASEMRLNILNNAINSTNGLKYFITAAQIKFNNQLNDKYISLFCNSLEVDTFDVPFKPYIIIYRLGFKWCGIIFYVKNQSTLNEDPRKIFQYEISWCCAPDKHQFDDITISHKTNFEMFDKYIEIQNEYGDKKNVKKHKKKHKKKRKVKKKKKVKMYTNYSGESDDNKSDSEDSESVYDSDSDIDSEQEEKQQQNKSKIKGKTIKLKQIEDIFCVEVSDSREFKWKSVSMKVGENKKYFSKIIENLKASGSYFIRVRVENKFGWSHFSDLLYFTTPKMKKEKEIKLEVVKCRKYYSSGTYHPSQLLDNNMSTSSIYASPIESDGWIRNISTKKYYKFKDPDWIIFRPKNKKKKYYLTKLSIMARADGQSPKTIGLQIGDEKLSAIQECKQQQFNFLQNNISSKQCSKWRKFVNYKWIKCKPSKIVMIKAQREQTFEVNHRLQFGKNFNYYKLLFYDNQGGAGMSSCKYVAISFKLWGVQIK